jgi:hypothetical protein
MITHTGMVRLNQFRKGTAGYHCHVINLFDVTGKPDVADFTLIVEVKKPQAGFGLAVFLCQRQWPTDLTLAYS